MVRLICVILATLTLFSLVACSATDPITEDLYINDISTGTITYSSSYWDDLRTPVSAIRITGPAGIWPPVETAYKSAFVLAFQDQAVNYQTISWLWQLPHSRKLGTNMTAHIHTVPANAGAGNVYWQFTYATADIDGTFGAVTTTNVAQAMPAAADYHGHEDLATIPGSAINDLSGMILCSLARRSDNVLDTYNGSSVYLLEVDLHYEIDSPGSRTEHAK